MADIGTGLGVGMKVLGGLSSAGSADEAAGMLGGASLQAGQMLSDAALQGGDILSEGALTGADQRVRGFQQAQDYLQPMVTQGDRANAQLSYLLGLGSGRPAEMQSALDNYRTARSRFYADRDNEQLRRERDQALQAKKDARSRYKSRALPGYGSFGELVKPFQFEEDPGYRFRLAEGQKGVANALGARGMRLSGRALKEMNRYNQGFASNEFGNAFARDQAKKGQLYGMLSGQARQGINARSGMAGYAGNIGQARGIGTEGSANARASGLMGSARALSGGMMGAAQAGASGLMGQQRGYQSALGGIAEGAASLMGGGGGLGGLFGGGAPSGAPSGAPAPSAYNPPKWSHGLYL